MTRKNGLPDKRYKINRTLQAREHLFWQKYGTLICAIILGVLAGLILGKTVWDINNAPHTLLRPLVRTIEPKVVEVKAVETKCDFDAITYIRCAGEKLGMSNRDIMKAIRIARCESGFNQYAKNPNSTAKGIYQFIDGTWRANCLKDGNVYSFVDNINCFWKVYAKQGDRPWLSSVKCWL